MSKSGLFSKSLSVLLAFVLLVGLNLKTYALTNAQVILTENGSQANLANELFQITPDQKYGMFTTSANYIVSGDTNNVNDLFVRNFETNTVDRVNVSSGGAQDNGGANFGQISTNGRFVVFSSGGNNLAPISGLGGAGYTGGIYLRDRLTSQTLFIAARSYLSSTNRTTSVTPYGVSDDGRFVYYDITVSGGSPGEAHGSRPYRLDRLSNNLLDLTGGVGSGAGASISCDNKLVAFNSSASDLVPGDNNGQHDVFLASISDSGTVILKDATINGNGTSSNPRLSCDGKYMYFSSTASNLVADDTNNFTDAFRYDVQSGQIIRISVGTNGAQMNGGNDARESTDHRFVAFNSDTIVNSIHYDQVYIHDNFTNDTKLLSQNSNGQTANSYSQFRGISSDGQSVYYVSAASNLGVSNPNNNGWFLYRASNIGFPVDQAAPVIAVVPDRQPNANGWYDGDVTINWNVNDPSPSSGTPTQPPAVVADQEGEHTYTSGQSCDPAGNCATGSTTLKIDKTDPDITYSVAPVVNAAGWQNSVVTVTFNCIDSASGIDSCSAPVTVSADGQNQTVSGTAVDKAGNTTSVTASVNLDTTKPTIGYTLTPVANGNGWNNTDVTAHFVCADGLSGVVDCSADHVFSTEGANQTTTGSVSDAAGNSDSMTTNPVNIDKTAPTITYSVNPAPNSNGQNNSQVTVTFDCSDALSGVDSCTQPVTLTADGQNQTVIGTATDKAGNTASVTATVNIDTVAPVVSYATNVLPNTNGWYNSDVILSWQSTDPAPSSGMPTQPAQTVASQEGTETYTSSPSCDPADNCATGSAALSIDKTAPSIGYTVSSAANGNGWNNGAVTITFNCSDLISGIDSCSNPVTLTNDGTGQVVTGTAIDMAGNVSTVTVVVNIDSGNPTITYSASPAANTYGWNNSSVLVHFTCLDSLAGIASCSNDSALTNQGVNQTVTGTAVDNAGNTTSITTSPINIDLTAPTVTNVSIPALALIGQTFTITANAFDALAGIANGEFYIDTDPGQGHAKPMAYANGTLSASSGSLTGLGLGTHTVYVRSMDKAGNYSMRASAQFLYLGL